MHVDSFILTAEPPRHIGQLGEVEIGRSINGIFVPERFPSDIRCGAYVELAFEPDESGEFHVELRLFNTEIGPTSSLLVAEHDIRMPLADDGWDYWRLSVFTSDVDIEVTESATLLLVLFVDDEPLAERVLFVRSD